MIVVLLCQEIGKLHAARLLCRLTISIRANADSLATKNTVLPSPFLLRAVFCTSLAWTRTTQADACSNAIPFQFMSHIQAELCITSCTAHIC